MKKVVFLLISLFIRDFDMVGAFLWSPHPPKKYPKFHKALDKDVNLTTDDYLKKYNYPVSVHTVSTDDGYLLTMHRIPKPGHQPILLVHGIFSSSMSFVILGPRKSLDAGYDVWLANTRGNTYSRKHNRFSAEDEDFWKFSFHEIGLYDLPALIDFVRGETAFHQLMFIGHSQGATAFFVMCSMRPEYNAKIILMQALAPLYLFKHANISKSDVKKAKKFVRKHFKSRSFEIFTSSFVRKQCMSSLKDIEECMDVFQKYIGPFYNGFNPSIDVTLFAQLTSGGSVQQLDHVVQIHKSGDFCSYDYGYEGNYKTYGKVDPDLYNVSQITVPTIIHFGDNDFLASPWDTHYLYKEIQSTVGLYNILNHKYNHFDFIAAKNVQIFMYNRIMVALHKFVEGKLKYMIE